MIETTLVYACAESHKIVQSFGQAKGKSDRLKAKTSLSYETETN